MGMLNASVMPVHGCVAGSLEFRLLNDFQRDFPLVAKPYAALAERLGTDEATVIATLQSLRERGVVSRVGAVFRPNVVGVSALAALSVPTSRVEEVAAQVSAMPEVNHNYEREHHFNLWFVVTASSAQHLQDVFRTIETSCRCGSVLVLPLLEQFHIDLGFGLAPSELPYFQHGLASAQAVDAIVLTDAQRTFMGALQAGLPLVSRPFAALGWAESDAIALLSRWNASGVIKRMGVVVRHHELGFTANAMVVWDVPDAEVSAVGKRIAESSRVSLCYRRPRELPHWPYNLFCMIHGRDRSEVEQRIVALVQSCALALYPHEVLFSCRRFKQRGARYAYPSHARLSEVASGSN